MVCFLLTAPAAFVLLPLGVLLAFQRPARLATALWLAGSLAWSASWLYVPGPLAEQVLKGWTVVTAGVFVLLVLEGKRRPVDAAITAVLTASLGTLAWLRLFRIDGASLTNDTLRLIWGQYRALGDAAPGLRADLAAFSQSAADASVVFPGAVMLFGVAGALLAWRWYHRLADRPLGDAPGPFREFRFSDHYVWFLVVALAGILAQAAALLPSGAGWPADLLVLFGGLYLARGMAVVRDFQVRRGPLLTLPFLVLLAALLFVLFLLPFALVALLGLGLADTWLDFRRPPAAAPVENDRWK